MKCYKEINDGIEVPEALKEETFLLMKKGKTSRFMVHKKLVTACLVLLIALGVVSSQQTKQEKSSVGNPTSLQAYMYDIKDEQSSDTSLKSKIAGEFQTYDIAGESIKYTINDFPLQNMVKIEQLVVPENFEATSRHLTWSYEDQGPYPYILYNFTYNDQYIEAEIKDERIPNCIQMDLPYKSYKAYDLCIYRNVYENGRVQYHVYAKKDGFQYNINAMMDNEEALLDFVESFLI